MTHMAWISQHKLLFIIIVVLVAGGVWYGLSSSGEPTALLTTQDLTTGSPTADSADQQLVGSLLTLRAVTLSGTIFSDTAFMSLQDFGTTIVPEPVGRPNPFEPIGSSTPAAARQSSQSAAAAGSQADAPAPQQPATPQQPAFTPRGSSSASTTQPAR